MAHHYAPDKEPAVRLRMHEEAGELRIPFTSGMLLGIGENDAERVDTLLAIRALARPLRPHPGSDRPALPPEAGHADALGVAAISDERGRGLGRARAPRARPRDRTCRRRPTSRRGLLELLLRAGANDWGGVSPVTVDFINPEAPWPTLRELRAPHRGGRAAARRAPARLSRAPARDAGLLRAASCAPSRSRCVGRGWLRARRARAMEAA